MNDISREGQLKGKHRARGTIGPSMSLSEVALPNKLKATIMQEHSVYMIMHVLSI